MRVIDFFAQNPRKLLLIDAIGAIFSLLLLQLLKGYLGMPYSVVNYLTVIAACLFLISATCFVAYAYKPLFFLLLGVGNTLYCLSTLALLCINYPIITSLGIAYFVIEVIIISLLVYIEIGVYNFLCKQ